MKEMFDLEQSIAGDYISSFGYVWQALERLSDFICKVGESLSKEEYYSPSENVWISKTALISEACKINGPCIICAEAEIRHGAFIRGKTIIGRGSVVGNSCEIKNSLLFNMCQVPHFNYVGDSILGYRSHLGAGSVTSNLKCDGSEVVVRTDNIKYYTGLRKLGALIGDGVQIGCNVTLNPGTVIGRNSIVYPNISLRGCIPDNTICKGDDNWVKRWGKYDG